MDHCRECGFTLELSEAAAAGRAIREGIAEVGTVIYPYPEPTERSLRWLALHTLHEVRHHLLDIRRQTGGQGSAMGA